MPATKPTRKYALTRLDAGDYVFPSNDGKTLWRVAKYTDGPSTGLDWPRDREVWGLWKWDGPIPEDAFVVDIADWNRWEQWDATLDTRQEAIDSALEDEA